MGSVEEVRNNYNFVQAGLSTLAAAASVALCMARKRLDSEIGVGDFFTTTRLIAQNNHGALRTKPVGDNGMIVGVCLEPRNANVNKWIAHNTWVLGSCSVLVPLWCKYEPGASNSIAADSSSGSQCTCWHVPSISMQGTGRLSIVGSNQRLAEAVTSDPQCYRVSSYQCELHGKDKMAELHAQVIQINTANLPLNSGMLEGPSQLYQIMLEDQARQEGCTYLFGVDRIGAKVLSRMVAESLATLDSSQKGRTSDLVDWSLGKVQLSEKPSLQWHGSTLSVLLVAGTEFVLTLLFALVFGLDPFVSCLGARRGIRSLRLGANGVTQFGDLWLTKVQGMEISTWETPVLKLVPRKDLKLFYADSILKVGGLVVVSIFWMLTVFGLAHPFGLKREDAWKNTGKWAVYLALVGNVIGLLSSGLPLRLESSLPGQSRDAGYGMVGYSILQCFVELAVTSLRLVHGPGESRWLVSCWYVVLELGIWTQWFSGKKNLFLGPQSSADVPYEVTITQAGALARAAILAAISGKWSEK